MTEELTRKEIVEQLEKRGIKIVKINIDQLFLLHALIEDVQKELEK